ncbi:GntR family transcriptional regulator [Variovorax sp. MHTC-1]|uniref:GntR family transcriptional regulator n=1 Tax=Variovorax sp. MHTC-1 TaxID=2495593 RepID=UPI000F871901|nr:GntR family transcriptional regulator [Variovorax sp. MHTC-1]RST53767.1 GntR family transcriptional regulator [Variovorax sp. MHTC-1]
MTSGKSNTLRKRSPQPLSAEQVCERIRSAILSGELKPGSKLTEQDLAAELEVSRTPVREAIRQLEVERLVSRTPFVGVTVAQLSPEEVIELLDIREVLEGLVARLATENMDSFHLQRLKKSLQQLAASARKSDVGAYLDQALAFRRALVECCGSATLSEHVMAIENRLRLTGSRTALLPGRMEAAIEEHEKLLDAIVRGDAKGAERLNRERIRHIRDAVAKSMSFSII